MSRRDHQMTKLWATSPIAKSLANPKDETRDEECSIPDMRCRIRAVSGALTPRSGPFSKSCRECCFAAKLAELTELIEKGDLKPWEFQGMKAIWFGRHLYEPLLYVDQKIVEISPVPLNKGERRFVEDLKAFHHRETDYFAGKELYLLRNLSKGRGVGFFEAGNFHPDFIVWLFTPGLQHILFVDPKGIRNIGATDPKVQF
jgi:hypothetical protein